MQRAVKKLQPDKPKITRANLIGALPVSAIEILLYRQHTFSMCFIMCYVMVKSKSATAHECSLFHGLPLSFGNLEHASKQDFKSVIKLSTRGNLSAYYQSLHSLIPWWDPQSEDWYQPPQLSTPRQPSIYAKQISPLLNQDTTNYSSLSKYKLKFVKMCGLFS